jgi:hypothetical protein
MSNGGGMLEREKAQALNHTLRIQNPEHTLGIPKITEN